MMQKSHPKGANEVKKMNVLQKLKDEQQNRYGSVPVLAAEELADPAELERLVAWQMWGPILTLRPSVGASLGAFGNGRCCEPDWEAVRPARRRQPGRAAAQPASKTDKGRDELAEVLRRLDLTMASVRTPAKYLVLKYLRMGIIDLDQIVDVDMRGAAELHLRARHLRAHIAA